MIKNGIGLPDIAQRINELLDEKYDIWAAFTGREGVGKSTGNITLAMDVDEDFDIVENVVYRKEERLEKYNARDKGQALVIDEGLQSYFKQLWNTKQQQTDTIIFSMSRQRNLYIGLCVPRFFDLNINFRSWRFRNWFHVMTRGKLWWSVIDDDPFCGPDPWHLINKKLHHKKCRRSSLIFFNQLPKNIESEYIKLKEKAFDDILKECIDNDEDQNIKFNNKQKRILNEDKAGVIDMLYAEMGGVWSKDKCIKIGGLTKDSYYKTKRDAD